MNLKPLNILPIPHVDIQITINDKRQIVKQQTVIRQTVK